MCGICGIINTENVPVSKKALLSMNGKMYSRGPDDEGFYIHSNVGLAMRRLSIIDLDGGHQPISNEDESIHVILNGEIYNYIELRKKLLQKGHRFKSNSDTEVIVHLYEEYGTDAVHHLIGMFAFALWDQNKKSTWIVRDRLGIKPLVYYQSGDTFLFSSTLDSLCAHPSVQREFDQESMLLYFSLAYIPAPRTIWKGIKKLMPGHWMLINSEGIHEKCYWDIKPNIDIHKKQDEWVGEIRELFQHSIELHSRSDVPVGTFLSGGVDSSAVTAFFCNQTDRSVDTFSMDFEGKAMNEGHYAKLVADRYNTNHHPYMLNLDQAIVELRELLPLMDEPMADSAIIPSYILSKWSRSEEIKVILCGSGGDELFGGYGHHYRSMRDQFAGSFPAMSPTLLSLLSSILGGNLTHYGGLLWDKGTAFGLGTSGIHLGHFSEILNGKKTFSSAMELTKDQFSNIDNLEKEYGFGYSRLIADIKNFLPDNVLAVTDKTSMAASIEARVPILDHRLVELAFEVSPNTNLGNGFEHAKTGLKNAARAELPKEILNRPKAGFNAPVYHWMNSANNSIQDAIYNLHPVILEIFNPGKIKAIWENPKKRMQASESLFMLYVMDQWIRTHE
jgi:asparagine synthase (glutamine-hydrolysing)